MASARSKDGVGGAVTVAPFWKRVDRLARSPTNAKGSCRTDSGSARWELINKRTFSDGYSVPTFRA